MNKKVKKNRLAIGILTGVLSVMSLTVSQETYAKKLNLVDVLPNNEDIAIEVQEQENNKALVKISARKDVENVVLRLSVAGNNNLVYKYKKLTVGQTTNLIIDLAKNDNRKILPVTSLERRLERFSTNINNKEITGSVEYSVDVAENSPAEILATDKSKDIAGNKSSQVSYIAEIKEETAKKEDETKKTNTDNRKNSEGEKKEGTVPTVPAKEDVNIEMFILSDGKDLVLDILTFELVNKENPEDVISLVSDMSMLKNIKLKKDTPYTLRLKDNTKFDFKPLDIILDNNEGIPKILGTSNEILVELKLSPKIEEKEKVAIPFIMLMHEKMPLLGEDITFELVDKEQPSEVILATSKENMLTNIEVKKDTVYSLRLKDNSKYEFKALDIIVDNEYGEPKLLTSKETLSEIELSKKAVISKDNVLALKELKVKVLNNDKAINKSSIRLIMWDGRIPSVIDTVQTNAEGEYTFSNLQANSKYEIRMNNKNFKFAKDVIEFTTDNKGNINLTTQTVLENGKVVFRAYDKQSKDLQTSQVKFKVIDKITGLPVGNVELTANTLQPKTASYKTIASDKEGNVVFDLEGAVGLKQYSICVAKNAQFMYKFEPEEITINIDENGKVEFKDGAEAIFKVTKEDRSHLRKDLELKIAEAKDYLLNNQVSQDFKTKLEQILNSAREELNKSETIPLYVEGFIKNINDALAEIKSKKV